MLIYNLCRVRRQKKKGGLAKAGIVMKMITESFVTLLLITTINAQGELAIAPYGIAQSKPSAGC